MKIDCWWTSAFYFFWFIYKKKKDSKRILEKMLTGLDYELIRKKIVLITHSKHNKVKNISLAFWFCKF